MIVTQVAAQVRRVLRGHSDRALVHAVDADGLEYKIEVPLSAVGALRDDQGYVVMVSYAIHSVPGLSPPLPEAASPEAPPSTTTPTPGPAGAGPIPGGPGTSATAEDPAISDAAVSDAARVDAQFMALMDRRRGAPTSPEAQVAAPLAPPLASPPSTPEPQARAADDPIAALLGLRR